MIINGFWLLQPVDFYRGYLQPRYIFTTLEVVRRALFNTLAG